MFWQRYSMDSNPLNDTACCCLRLYRLSSRSDSLFVSVLIILTCRNVFVFFFCLPQYCPVPFIRYAFFQITKDMRKTLLVFRTIVIKGFLMIVNRDSQVIFNRSAFYSFVPFFPAWKIHRFSIRGSAHKYIGIFHVFPCIGTIRIKDGGSGRSANIVFRSCSVFLANSLLSLLTMPLDMLSLPSVRSERNFLLLSMEVQQSLFNRKRKALTLPP